MPGGEVTHNLLLRWTTAGVGGATNWSGASAKGSGNGGGGSVPQLNANRIQAPNDPGIRFRRTTGEVRLARATIGGQLSWRGVKLQPTKGVALNMDRAEVKGGVFLIEGFTATGEVRLLGATIGGTTTFELPSHAETNGATGTPVAVGRQPGTSEASDTAPDEAGWDAQPAQRRSRASHRHPPLGGARPLGRQRGNPSGPRERCHCRVTGWHP